MKKPRPSIQPKKSKIPWEEIRTRFVQGIFNEREERVYPTLRELAEEFHLHLGTVGRKSSRESWLLERERFANRVLKEKDKRAAEATARVAAKIDGAAAKFALSAIAITSAKLQAGVVQGEEGKGPQIQHSPSDLVSLTRAGKTAQEMGKVAVGETPENAENPLFALEELRRRAREAQEEREAERGG